MKKKSLILSSLGMACFAISTFSVVSLAQVIVPSRPITITPHLGNIIGKGYKIDRRVVLKNVSLQTFKIPQVESRLPQNETELVDQNTVELMTNGDNEFVVLKKQIPLTELVAWKNITISFESTFVPGIGLLKPEPPAGNQLEEGPGLILRPLPGPIHPIPIPIPGPIRPINPRFSSGGDIDRNDEYVRAFKNGDLRDDYTKSVLGADGRVQINPTNNYPWRAIGMVGGHCSGALIGPRHVLTAAHCVYDVETNQWIGNLNFTPGKNAGTAPFGIVPWSMVLAKKGWTQDHNGTYDWALIVLSQPVGQTVGWLGYGYNYAQPVINLNIAGYPGDKTFGTQWRSYCSGTVFPYIVSSKVPHKCDTYPGESGSPMWMYVEPNYRSVRAIHTNGSPAGLYVPDSNSNFAVIIDSYVFNTLKLWKSAHP